MPRLTNRNPSYRKHRASGRAIVSLDNEDIYVGPFGSKTSRDEHDRVIGEWLEAQVNLVRQALTNRLRTSTTMRWTACAG